MFDSNKIRNIAIIAHVDHGKTTLVDQLIKKSETLRARENLEEIRQTKVKKRGAFKRRLFLEKEL